MKEVRIGIIGLGGMGFNHTKYIKDTVQGGRLTAVCDIDPARLELAKAEFGDKVQRFDNVDVFFANAPVDAVLIQLFIILILNWRLGFST